ncbi:MAG: alpha-L-rhamnosidase C-terminal domain-containing protein [Terrimicrobiaceae bacterium]
MNDSRWTAQPAGHPWNGMPWYSLEPRGIPMLEENILLPAKCLGTASGRCAKDFRSVRDVARLRFDEGLGHRPWDFKAVEIRVAPPGRGRFRSFLIDFGKTVVGSLGLEISGAKGGEILDALHVETIDEATLTPHFEPDKHCRMAFGHRLICRAGEQTHVFYHTFGFRYMVLTLRDSAGSLTVRPYLRTTVYPLEQHGAFHNSDAALEKIWETCAWTQRVCSLDAYVDTPWREQAQWWGDARVQAKNTFFYSGDTRLFRRGIAQIAAQTLPNGLTYGHAPTVAHGCILPDFTLIWLITLWDYSWQTGSPEPFLAHQETIRGALKYFEEMTNPQTGLVGCDKRYWLFLDWTGIFKDGYSTVYNLWLLVALEKLVPLFRTTGKPAEARRLAAWAARLRKSLGALARKDGLLCDGLTFDGKPVATTSIHSQTLAILAGFQPEHNAARIAKILLPFIRRETTPEISPSCYWITYVFEVLTAAGHGAEVVDFIREKWTPMAAHGTTWEVFAPRVGDESFSHAWSAHPLYHLMQVVGGIRQNAAGWKEIVFQPHFIGEEADVTVPTPLGNIRSVWKREDGGIKVSLSLPEGISAAVLLPGLKSRKVRNNFSWVLDNTSKPLSG